MRMSARVDGVASRVQSAIQMRNVTNSMAGVVKSMDSALKSMNLEKVCYKFSVHIESKTLEQHFYKH